MMEQSRAWWAVWPRGVSGGLGGLYAALFHLLRREGYQGLGDWLWDGLRYVESPYGALSEQGLATPPWRTQPGGRWGPSSFWRMDCDRYWGCQSAAPVGALRCWLGCPGGGRCSTTLTASRRLPGEWLRPVRPATEAFVWDSRKADPSGRPGLPPGRELMGYRLQRGGGQHPGHAGGHLVNNVLLFGEQL